MTVQDAAVPFTSAKAQSSTTPTTPGNVTPVTTTPSASLAEALHAGGAHTGVTAERVAAGTTKVPPPPGTARLVVFAPAAAKEKVERKRECWASMPTPMVSALEDTVYVVVGAALGADAAEGKLGRRRTRRRRRLKQPLISGEQNLANRIALATPGIAMFVDAAYSHQRSTLPPPLPP